MSLLTLLILVVAVGVFLFLVQLAQSKLGLDPWICRVVTIAVIVIVIVYVCRGLGVFQLLDSVRI